MKNLQKFLPEIVGITVLLVALLGQRVYVAFADKYQNPGEEAAEAAMKYKVALEAEAAAERARNHVETPAFVKGIYMNAGTAMGGKQRDDLVKILKETELNSVVIDIKDDFGRIAYPSTDPELQQHLSSAIMIEDLDALIQELHEARIYVIARLFVFQDRALVAMRPDLAVQSTLGGVWRDFKGVSWIDAAAQEAWEYNARIARDAYSRGFDEIQLDYIRFPSDGNMKTIRYTHFDAKKETRTDVMTRFFKYMDTELRQKGIPISADLFGYAFWYRDEDLTIGQRIRDAAPYFTALSPMAYPSHYSATRAMPNPANYPYELVAETMKRGKDIMAEWPEVKWASRPWLQDFDIGANYDKAKVQAQMKAVADEGGAGWMLWNARNVYTVEALGPKEVIASN